MERVLNKEINERHVDTKGVFIDTYFVGQRDSITEMGRVDKHTSAIVRHTEEYSIAGFQVENDDTFWYYKLYKNKLGGRLHAIGLTFCKLDGVNIEDLRANKQYKF